MTFNIGDRVRSRAFPERVGTIAYRGYVGSWCVKMDNPSHSPRADGTRSYSEQNLVLIEAGPPPIPPEELAWADFLDQQEEPVTDHREIFLAGYRAAWEQKGARS